ncbi:MAG: aldehyde dehydrogenase family protein [Planctomycetes bacterium]|nr:aldehyde dehydrogenase family protein [Planctomycetota bacterium]
MGEHIRARRAELSVLIGYEAGKSRLEAAGIFSEDEADIEEFFTRIEAGVTYANRRAGATTGAWPGINSFGGWKASGSTGKGTGGPHYLQQFFREQSRVRVT